MSGAKPIPATGVVVVADRGPVKIETHRTTFAGKKVKKTPLAIQKEREAAEAARHYVVMGKGQDAAIREVNSDARINKTDAKATYKVSDAQRELPLTPSSRARLTSLCSRRFGSHQEEQLRCGSASAVPHRRRRSSRSSRPWRRRGSQGSVGPLCSPLFSPELTRGAF